METPVGEAKQGVKKGGWTDDVQPVASGDGPVEETVQPFVGVSIGREGRGGEGIVGEGRGAACIRWAEGVPVLGKFVCVVRGVRFMYAQIPSKLLRVSQEEISL